MCESLRPGITVRPPRSMTSRLSGAMSHDLFIGSNRGEPPVLDSDGLGERTALILSRNTAVHQYHIRRHVICRHTASSEQMVTPINAASFRMSLRVCSIALTGGECSPQMLLVRSRRHDVFGILRRGRAVHHRVGVLHADAVGAEVALHDVHDRVIAVALAPNRAATRASRRAR